MIIINPKCGDKVISSSTDGKIAEYCAQFEKFDQSKSINGNESDNDALDKKKVEVKKPPCSWKFFNEKKNDPNFIQGFRIQITHQKVKLKTI